MNITYAVKWKEKKKVHFLGKFHSFSYENDCMKVSEKSILLIELKKIFWSPFKCH